MFQLWKNIIWRDVCQNRLRTSITILGIAIGVSVFLAINMANNTTLEQFKTGITTIAGTTNLQIVPKNTESFDETILKSLPFLWDEHATYTPVIEQTGTIQKQNALAQNAPVVVHVLGVDMFQEPQFREYAWAPNGEPKEFTRIFDTNTLYITQALAEALHVKRNDKIELALNDTPQQFEITGITQNNHFASAYGGNLALMDIGVLQAASNLNGRLNRIDITAPENKLEAITQQLKQNLPGYLALTTPAMQGQQTAKMLQAFQSNLTALSFISMLVGMFLIYSTLSITVLRRRKEIATLKAIGVSSRQIFALFMGYTLLIASVGSILGCALGILFAQLSLGEISQTVQSIYTGSPVTSLNINYLQVTTVLFAGVIFSILATLQPLFEATQVRPALGTRQGHFEIRVLKSSRKLLFAGLFIGLIAYISALQPAINNFPFFGFLSSLLSFFAAALCIPFVLENIIQISKYSVRKLFGINAYIGLTQLTGSLGRVSVSVASLMVGIAMMISLAVMIHSFRGTVNTWIEQTLKADIFVEPEVRNISKQAGGLSPETIKIIASIPGVEAIDKFTEFPSTYNGNPMNIGAGTFDILFKYGKLQLKNNDTMQTVYTRLKQLSTNTAGCIVSETFADKNHYTTGDVLLLDTPSGRQKITITGIYYDYASENGYIILPRPWFEKYFQDDRITSLAIYLNKSSDSKTVKQLIESKLSSTRKNITRLNIRTNRDLKLEVLKIFDKTFAITYALHFIAIIVALLSIVNTLITLVLESKKDFALLNCLGFSQDSIKCIIFYQSLFLGMAGYAFGLALGFLLSLLLVYVINKQSFGWSIQYAVPLDFIAQSAGIIMLSSALAGLLVLWVLKINFDVENLRDE